MSRVPLLPTRLVDGVWVTDLEIAGQTVRAEVTYAPPPLPPAREIPPPSHGVVIPVNVSADDWRKFVEFHDDPVTIERDPATGEICASFDAEATRPDEEPIPVRVTVTWTPPRTIYAAIDPRGDIVALGRTQDEARALVVKQLDLDRSIMHGSPESYTEWLNGFTFVAMTGATHSLRAIVQAATMTKITKPWGPQNFWDSSEVTP